MPDDPAQPAPAPIPGPTPTGYQRTQGGGFKWQPPTPEHLSQLLPQYEIEALAGRGGMGAVYRGRQKTLDRLVAIKILPPEVDDEDASYTQRFKNEAKIMAKLEHPAIVPVHDFGETSTGLFYFVMGFVDGTDVHQMIQQQGRLPPEHALAITAHVCDALRYAHEHGVVHRDIKPSNVLINMDGQVKVADFGLAKVDEPGSSGLTKSGMAMGTPDYVAPETLMMGVNVDGRADLYAVGVMLYQMLTGNVPRGAFKPASVMIKEIDPRFDAIVQKAMQMDREERYQSAAEMRKDLDVILTTPLVQHGGQSSAAIPKQSLPQKPVAKGPQKPMGKSANVPVRKGASVAGVSDPGSSNARDPGSPGPLDRATTAKSRAPLLIGIAAVVAIALGAFFLLGGKKAPVGDDVRSPSSAVGDDVRSPSSQRGTAPERLVTSSPTPIKVRENPKPAVSTPISNPKSTISNPQAFPPGQWVKVFTKLEDLPDELRKAGVSFEDGWIRFQGIKRWIRCPMFSGTNYGVRLHFLRNRQTSDTNHGPASISVRMQEDYKDGYNARLASNELVCYRRADGKDTKIATIPCPLPPIQGAEGSLEFSAVGSRLIARLGAKCVMDITDKKWLIGSIVVSGSEDIRDIEVINLDGIPEAEALRILGVDEKGNDLRAKPSAATSPPAMAATPPAVPVSQSPDKFPPGQWVNVTDELQKSNPKLLKQGTDGWTQLSEGTVNRPDSWKRRNCAIKLRFDQRTDKNGFQLSLKGDSAIFNLAFNLSKQELSLTRQNLKGQPGNIYQRAKFSASTVQVQFIELGFVNRVLVARVNQQMLSVVVPESLIEPSLLPGLFGGAEEDFIRDVEIINLDGIPEAEALRILGVDEKGNDLRAAALAQEKQKAVQQKQAETITTIPELAALNEQFVKLKAERVSAPFEAEVAKLNSGYTGGLDREIEKEKKAGHLDGVLLLEAEKKFVPAVAGVNDPGTPGSMSRATTMPIPAEDDDATPANLKGLRKIYRDTFAKHEATRAANLKQLTDPLTIRLKQLESTLTQKNRIDHAKTVREYREGLLVGRLGETAGGDSQSRPTTGAAKTNEADKSVRASLITESSSRYSQREVAEWVLSIGGTVEIKDRAGKKVQLKQGDKVPAGQISISAIGASADFPQWPLTDNDLARFRGLDDLAVLEFQVCVDVTGTGLTLLGKLPMLKRLILRFPNMAGSNLAKLPDFPQLTQLSISSSFTPEEFSALPSLKALTSLAVRPVSSEHLAAYAKRTKLAQLDISRTEVKDENLEGIKGMKNLETLNIGSTNHVTGGGLTLLQELPKLTWLELGGGAAFETKNFALIGGLNHLTKVVLHANRWQDDPAEYLKQLSALNGPIKELELMYADKMTEAQIAELKQALPKVKVTVRK